MAQQIFPLYLNDYLDLRSSGASHEEAVEQIAIINEVPVVAVVVTA